MELGTMYLKGNAMIPGFECRSSLQISFGDTVPGKVLQWVQYGKLLVADRCACYMIAWEDLDRLGYIFGYPVRIDGKPYLCRSLEVGSLSRSMNEWDSILDDLGDDDSIWHWKGQWFWGQEQAAAWTHRYVRGNTSARYRCDRSEQHISDALGFRPVLEPLSPAPLDKKLGSKITVYGPHKIVIQGTLAGFDDYDIALDGVEPLYSGCDWAVRTKGGQAVVRRSAIIRVV